MNVNTQPLDSTLFSSPASSRFSSRAAQVTQQLSWMAIACLAAFSAAAVFAQSPMSPAERPSAQPGTTEQAPSSSGGVAPNRQPSDQQISKQFQAADANGDGKLSKEEAKTGMPGVYRNFERIDTKGQGFITQEDLMMAMKR
jgi:EF hand